MIDYKPISFDEWIKLNPEVAKAEEKCGGGGGNGSKTCYGCGSKCRCDCEECDGKGSINLAMDKYDQQVKRDAEKWQKVQAGT